jgi:gamma-glutamyltranspeptidase / glutathione hydrolase
MFFSFHRSFMIVLAIVQAAFVSPAQAIPFEGHKLLMSGPSAYAVEAGKAVQNAGGNVVDVAVAMGLVLSVTAPYFGSLGGGGFALIKMKDNPVTAVDFREMAPAATSMAYFAKLGSTASRTGGTAVGIPGNPAGYFEMNKKYGKLKWQQLFDIALKYATKGYRVSGEWVENTESTKERFSPGGLKYFFKKDKSAYLPGDELKQPQLADALTILRNEGPKGFYEGRIAEDIVKSVHDSGGAMTLKDLQNYKVRWLKPLETDFSGYHIYLMPPPSSGGVLIELMLSLVEKANLVTKAFLSVDELHWLTEIESRAFRGRYLLGDPDFHQNPLSYFTSRKEVDLLYKSIDPKKAVAMKPLVEKDIPKESTETTHMSVLDDDGNAVSMTITLNGDYGSGVVTSRYGIALNNEMDDFTTKPDTQNMYGLYQGSGNNVEPGKRPLSSMSPALVAKDGKVMMAVGAPGGPRIISGVFQVLYRVLAQGLDLDRAIQAPRIHHQYLPDTLMVDKLKLPPETLEALRKMGHKVEERGIAKVYAVRKNERGVLEAAFDSRGEGAVGGY